MKRRTTLFMALLAATSLTSGAVAASTTKPNIVFIMADDLGWQELGCYGQKKILTPHIDGIAKEGMRFTQYYSGSPVCAPARCNLLTGKHGGHAFSRDNHEIPNPSKDRFGGQLPLPADIRTIAEALKAKGYATGCFGKWGLGPQGSSGDPLKQGFDRFYGYNCQRNAHNLYPKYLEDDDGIHEMEGNPRRQTGKHYAPQLIADRMLDFVQQHKDEPFFLYYPTVIPHLPLQVPEKDLKQYLGKWEETPYTGRSYQPHPTPKACYAAMISFMDRQVGRLMQQLKDLGLDENTIVFFTSDNGTTHLKSQVDYTFFDSVGPLRGLKGSVYEGGLRVPMVVRWPGRIAPTSETALTAAHYDVPATLSDLVGGDMRHTDGISFLPTLLGETGKQQHHDYLFWDFAGYGGQLAVRKGKWKAVRRDLKKNPMAPLELYNLDDDVGEKTDVAKHFPDVAQKLETIMLAARTRPEAKRFQFGAYSDD
ncbi:MAG: arylsulfatase A [Candidatus Promineifilaceae bacterium]|jgi:arylsulfatase A